MPLSRTVRPAACLAAVLLLVSLLPVPAAEAGLFGDRRASRLGGSNSMDEEAEGGRHGRMQGQISIPGVKTLRDIPYGKSAKQKIDVYIPPKAANAPIVVMVHGGGWRTGDKSMTGVITNKGDHYLGKGYIFVSVNNRLVPEAAAIEQANDVAMAIAYVQNHAAQWGGNPAQLVLMGHSAGAHLVGLLGADPSRVVKAGGRRWSGTVPLDSAALDVLTIMRNSHRGIYDNAFGADPALWAAASPLHQVKAEATPLLVVCSSRRKDSCPPAHAVADKAKRLGVMASVLEQPLNHGQINNELGEPGAYTDAVDSFIRTVFSAR